MATEEELFGPISFAHDGRDSRECTQSGIQRFLRPAFRRHRLPNSLRTRGFLVCANRSVKSHARAAHIGAPTRSQCACMTWQIRGCVECVAARIVSRRDALVSHRVFDVFVGPSPRKPFHPCPRTPPVAS